MCCNKPFFSRRYKLTGNSNMAVRFALINHVHNLLRAGNETLGAALSTRVRECEKG